jgi:Rrf2 family iron-sulfur cluster assembly transcriptional regulator
MSDKAGANVGLATKTEDRPDSRGGLLAGCGRVARALLRPVEQEVAMIFSRTSQYAIQALIYLAAQPSGKRELNREIAQNLGVPSPYLAKILQDLSRGKLLHSSRGRSGGFSLRPGAEMTSLLDIVLMMESPRADRECLLGLKACNDETACPLHRKWKPIKKEILARLGKVTLVSLAQAVQSGEYRLTDLPSALSRG